MSDVILSHEKPETGVTRLRLPFALRGRSRPDFDAIRALCDYWESQRRGRIAPARSEIEAAPLADMLRFMFIAEIIAPGVARLRFAGQHLHDLLGMEPRGMPLSCLMAAPARDEVAEALMRVQRGARVQLPLRAPRGLGKPVIDGLLALLPLTNAAGRITRVLGMLETHGPIGRTPRRFELSAAPSTLAIDTAAEPLPIDPVPASSPQDPAAALTGSSAPTEGRQGGFVRNGIDSAAPAAPDAAPSGLRAHPARPGWRVIEGGRG